MLVWAPWDPMGFTNGSAAFSGVATTRFVQPYETHPREDSIGVRAEVVGVSPSEPAAGGPNGGEEVPTRIPLKPWPLRARRFSGRDLPAGLEAPEGFLPAPPTPPISPSGKERPPL